MEVFVWILISIVGASLIGMALFFAWNESKGFKTVE